MPTEGGRKGREGTHRTLETQRLRSFCDSNLKGERRRRGIKECVRFKVIVSDSRVVDCNAFEVVVFVLLDLLESYNLLCVVT